MNKILIILCLVFLVSCSPTEFTSDQIVERKGVSYELNSTTPFTGVVVDYHENGQLQVSSNYKDGKRDGLEEMYYENGQLSAKTNFKDGVRGGLAPRYAENGELLIARCYGNGISVNMSYCEK
ncbi:MAG: hypothetical protein QMC00_01150 [Pseudomonadales bacterium]|jgi:antitoxin component YwqK of YwqJK toxin-antitoxin module|tara:strand:+ start:6425 stop:6793 length:369 start_codon:yes stop_codon:yes gene_type:complete